MGFIFSLKNLVHVRVPQRNLNLSQRIVLGKGILVKDLKGQRWHWQEIMISDLKDNRLVCNIRWRNIEVDGVVVGWVGSALHLVACLHLIIRSRVIILEPWL